LAFLRFSICDLKADSSRLFASRLIRRAVSILIITLCVPALGLGADNGQMDYGFDGSLVPRGPRVNQTRPRTVELIGKAFLAGETVPRRVELVRDIGECRLVEGVPYIRSAMGESDTMVRGEAARAAGLIDDPSLLPDLRKIAEDPEISVRREVIVAAGLLKEEALVMRGLKESEPQLISAAMAAAFAPAHSAEIARRLPGLPANLRIQAIAHLARLDAREHAGAVAAFLDKSVALQSAAVEALGTLQSTAHGPAIIGLLTHAHPTVRRNATAALQGVVDAPKRQQLAIERLSDADLSVRLAAATILKANPAPTAIDALVGQLDVDHPPLHEMSRAALVATGDESVPAAAKLLRHAEPLRRVDGLYILAELKSDADLPQQLELLNDPDWRVVAEAARALGAAGRQEAVEPLLAMARLGGKPLDTKAIPADSASWIRAIENAIVACGKLGHGEIFADLQHILPLFETMPAAWRGAIIWVYGITTEPQNASAAGGMIGMIGNMKESEQVKIEIVKMLGNLRHKPSEGYLANWKTDQNLSPSPRLRFVAHWAYQRVSGKQIPYEPIPEFFTADVSISDLGDPE